MKSDLLLQEFLVFAKEKYGREIILESSETPDTFESVFGASFLAQEELYDVAAESNTVVYDDSCESFSFEYEHVSDMLESHVRILAA